MKDFFEKVGSGLTEAGEAVAAKAKEVTEIAKLRSKIRTNQNEIRKTYEKMGQALYENKKTGDELPEFEDEIELIQEKEKDIETCKEYIRAIKGTVICSHCGAEVPEDSYFCQKCGAKVEG